MENNLQDFIKFSNLKEKDRQEILEIVKGIQNNEDSKYIDRLVLFLGEPGTGKTHMAERIVKELNLPILFLGAYNPAGKDLKIFSSIPDLAAQLVNYEKCVVFIDDLNNLVEKDECDCIESKDAKEIFKIIEHIKKDRNKFLFVTMNENVSLDDSWTDRFDSAFKIELPDEETKINYILHTYPNFIKKSLITELASRSFGYNFRDIDLLIRTIYKKEKKNPTKKIIREALSTYIPKALARFEVHQNIKIKFSDVIGNEHIKEELLLFKDYIKNNSFYKKSGVKRNNLILFSGPHGTGKTLMAQALGRELDLPIIQLDAKRIRAETPFMMINGLNSIIKRFRNCVIVVDEAEKFLGKNSIFEEENMLAGTMASALDGINSDVEAIVLFIVNDSLRFGDAVKDRFQHFEFNLPGEKERKEFLQMQSSKINLLMNNDLTEEFVNKTEKFTYRKMENCWNKFIFRLVKEDNVKLKKNKLYAPEESVKNTLIKVLDELPSKRTQIGIG
jgi:AAA+ superfamily predicted ATPase